MRNHEENSGFHHKSFRKYFFLTTSTFHVQNRGESKFKVYQYNEHMLLTTSGIRADDQGEEKIRDIY